MEMKTKPTHEIAGLKLFIYFVIEFSAPRLQKAARNNLGDKMFYFQCGFP